MAGFDTPKALAKAMLKAADQVRQLDEASADLGATLVGLARSLAPHRSGTLRGTVAFRVGRPSKRFDSSVSVSAGGARAPYAAAIHWGWPSRPNPARKWRGGPIDKQPFLMDALGRMVDRQLPETVYSAKVSDILTKALG